MLWWSISDWRLKSFSSGIFSLLFLCLFFLSSILSLLCFLNAYQMNVGILGFSSMFLKLYFCIFNLIGFFPSFPLPPSLPFLFFLCLFLSVSFFVIYYEIYHLAKYFCWFLVILLFSPSVQYIILGIRFLVSKSSLLFSECLFLCVHCLLIIRT